MAPYLIAFVVAVFLLYTGKATLLPFVFQRRPARRERNGTKERSWDVTKVKTPPRDLHDVCEVIFLLRQRVVPDLIPDILDLAEYWIVTSAARASRRAKYTASTAGLAYVMATLPDYLPSESVRKIEFSTVSRDQGWSSFPADHNTYQNSHTWFEVVADEADGNTRVESFAPVKIITNVHAGKEWKKHHVVWTHDSEDRHIRGVVASLKGGQRIAITAHAQYPGWTNHVSSASIDLYTPRVRRG